MYVLKNLIPIQISILLKIEEKKFIRQTIFGKGKIYLLMLYIFKRNVKILSNSSKVANAFYKLKICFGQIKIILTIITQLIY